MSLSKINYNQTNMKITSKLMLAAAAVAAVLLSSCRQLRMTISSSVSPPARAIDYLFNVGLALVPREWGNLDRDPGILTPGRELHLIRRVRL